MGNTVWLQQKKMVGGRQRPVAGRAPAHAEKPRLPRPRSHGAGRAPDGRGDGALTTPVLNQSQTRGKVLHPAQNCAAPQGAELAELCFKG